jgi:hypothetical protein
MNYVKTYEEFIGDKVSKFSKKRKRKVALPNTNNKGKHYDQEADGSDQITGSTLNF